MKLLVGYGNTLRQDDGLGWLIADQLRSYYEDSLVSVISTPQLMPELALPVAECELVVFVDASVEGTAGVVCTQQLQAATALREPHTLQPADILGLADYLYGACPKAYLVTVTGESFGLGDTLSTAVQSAIPEVIVQIKELFSERM
jgi:hydrogenase maturation protease